MAPNNPGKEIPSPRTTHPGTCSGRKNSPSAEFGKFKKNKYQTLSDASEIFKNPSTHFTWLACQKSPQTSKWGVVQNSPRAEFGKLEKKNTKRYPMPPKFCRVHLSIVVSLPAKNQLKIPSVAW
ncbi:hypothetical protein ISI03_30450 [Burkholderia pseudomallei]|nr:hypothetical protein [Burkholderia pseudomallei]